MGLQLGRECSMGPEPMMWQAQGVAGFEERKRRTETSIPTASAPNCPPPETPTFATGFKGDSRRDASHATPLPPGKLRRRAAPSEQSGALRRLAFYAFASASATSSVAVQRRPGHSSRILPHRRTLVVESKNVA